MKKYRPSNTIDVSSPLSTSVIVEAAFELEVGGMIAADACAEHKAVFVLSAEAVRLRDRPSRCRAADEIDLLVERQMAADADFEA